MGPYTLDWETEQYKCDISHWISTILLGSLQALNLFWLGLICRVAWRAAVKGELEDERSEDDGEVEVVAEVEMNRESGERKSEVIVRGRKGMPKRRAR